MKLLGMERYGITMPDTIQLGEYSMSSGRKAHRTVPHTILTAI